MNFKRILTLALALIFIVSAFTACNKGAEQGADAGASTTASGTQNEQPADLYFDMVDSTDKVCYIVYPTDASEDVKELADKLSKRLKTILGMKLPQVISEDDIPNNPGNYICIGQVAYDEISAFHNELKYSDIGYKVISTGLLSVAAHNDENLGEAVKLFWNTFSKVITESKTLSDGSTVSGRYYPASEAKTKVATYKTETLNIDGVSVDGYKVVYSEDAKDAAYAIRDSIGRATGAILAIGPDSDTEVANEILVGATSRAASKKYEATEKHNYQIAIESGKMVVVAPHDVLMGIAADYVESTLNSAEAAKTVELTAKDNVLGTTTIEAIDLAGKDAGDFRILSSNLYFESQTRERASTFLYTVPLYGADIICLQEMDPTWHHLLDDEIPKLGYTAVPTKGTGEYANKTHKDNYTPIYYRADLYKLVDCGYKPFESVKDTKENVFVKYPELAKYSDKQKQNVLNEYVKNGTTYGCVAHLSKSFTWAIFESLETGEKFGVISTHMTHDNSATIANVRRMYDAKEVVAKTEELKAAYGVEFAVLGDFNFNSTETPYTILKNGGYTDAVRTAELYDYHYSTHTMGEKPGEGGLPIDMSFHTSGIDATKYQIVVNEYTITYSDHIPIAFDFKLK